MTEGAYIARESVGSPIVLRVSRNGSDVDSVRLSKAAALTLAIDLMNALRCTKVFHG